MSERIVFQTLNATENIYVDSLKVWAHAQKDGFTRSENENWFRFLVREQSALESILTLSTRIKWKKMTFAILSWQDPSYEDRGFIEIMCKQIATLGNDQGTSDGDLFKDVVSVYSVIVNEKSDYGLKSYSYDYNFAVPNYTGIRCNFSTDRNRYLEDKNIDVEHDSMVVYFRMDAPIKIEDYIESPIHGRFKVDMVVKNESNMLEAVCQRAGVQ